MRAHWQASPDPLTRLQAGDSDAFERFVQLETATFLGFFRRQGANPGEAEDLTQDLFLKLLRSAPGYREEARFVPFCFRVARNLWIDFERRRATRPERHSAEGLQDPADPAALDAGWIELERQEQGRRLLAALETLSAEHRSAFELAVVQELPYCDIAELLAIPVGTVKSRVFYAMRHLRERLGDEPSPAPAPRTPGREPRA